MWGKVFQLQGEQVAAGWGVNKQEQPGRQTWRFDMCYRDALIKIQVTNQSEVKRDEGCGSTWQTETCKGC